QCATPRDAVPSQRHTHRSSDLHSKALPARCIALAWALGDKGPAKCPPGAGPFRIPALMPMYSPRLGGEAAPQKSPESDSADLESASIETVPRPLVPASVLAGWVDSRQR